MGAATGASGAATGTEEKAVASKDATEPLAKKTATMRGSVAQAQNPKASGAATGAESESAVEMFLRFKGMQLKSVCSELPTEVDEVATLFSVWSACRLRQGSRLHQKSR